MIRFFGNVIYFFRYRYGLASRAFPEAKNSVVCAEISMSSKFHFSQWAIFAWFIFIDKCLKFEEIEYLIHYVKLEMWPALYCVNSLYFQQWISNWDIAFLNFTLDSNLAFLDVGLRLQFELFHNSQKYWKLWFLNVSLGCTSKLLTIG